MAFADWIYQNVDNGDVGLTIAGGNFDFTGNTHLTSHRTHCKLNSAGLYPIPAGKHISIRAAVSSNNGQTPPNNFDGVQMETGIFFGSDDENNSDPPGYLLTLNHNYDNHWVEFKARNRGNSNWGDTYDYGDLGVPSPSPAIGARSISLRMDIVPMYNGTDHDRDHVYLYYSTGVSWIPLGSHIITREYFKAQNRFAFRNDTGYGVGIWSWCSIPFAQNTKPFTGQSVGNFQVLVEDVT